MSGGISKEQQCQTIAGEARSGACRRDTPELPNLRVMSRVPGLALAMANEERERIEARLEKAGVPKHVMARRLDRLQHALDMETTLLRAEATS